MSGTLPEYSGLVRWTINDVGQWLSANGFPEFCRSFREAGIDGVKFVELDETEMNRMRTPMNKRGKLITIIKSIKKPDLPGIQTIISSRAPASPRIPQRDYNQKAPPQISATRIDSGIDDSGSGSDDDYEWAPSDFEDDHEDGGHGGQGGHGGHGHSSHNRDGHTGQTQEDSDSSPDDDYENTSEHKAPPVHRGETHKEKFSVANLKTALNDFKQNSVIIKKGHQNVQDDPEENYDEPDRKQPPPQPGRAGRTASPVSSQPALPSRPGRRAQPAPEEEQPPLPSRPGRRAQPAPKKEQPPQPARPVRRAQPVPSSQDDQSNYEETDISDLAPEDVYEDPDNPTSSQPPPPPRGGRRVIPTPQPTQNTRRPATLPVNEPEAYDRNIYRESEYYEDPNELPEAPKPPINDQPTYEELEEEQEKNKSNQKHKTPARPPGKTTPSKSSAPPTRGCKVISSSDSDTEDYEKPNEPTAPIPTRFQSRQKASRPPEPSPTDDQPEYMDMQPNGSQNLVEDDIYVVPDEEDNKKTSKAAPPPVNRGSRDLPKAPVNRGNRDLPNTPGFASQFRLPPQQAETPPVLKSNKKEPKKEPVVERVPPRSLPPPPKGGGSRPLPTVPPVNDQFADEVDDTEEDLSCYDWFRRNMTRQEGDTKLKQNSQNGMFAIRESNKKSADGDPRPYTLMIFNDKKVYNLPIRKRISDGHYAMGNPKPREETFPKLADLVAFFSKRMIVLAGSGQTHLKKPIP
ncbi:serine/arginine repetitive matrix protein 1-like isoform X5 [Mizuhopecten yessoensis]|uniref:serine/arginine repetitive matrix protein 1-like isoform X5 n=1 Tax=Mizuhopecten yessoensis TaxID=6573 RepID=UPI000B4592A6|nr:serine/arginine repetitive matrix protein 1-like isoform X5 [Mizuhopecten yessoensis]